MSRNVYSDPMKCGPCYTAVLLLIFCLMLLPSVSLAINHPTTSPYEVRPTPDGYLVYEIQPVPAGLTVERDVMVAMPDGVRLACNVYRPAKPGKFPVILSETPYGKDQTPVVYNPDGSPVASAYNPFVFRVHAQGEDVGHMKISMLTPWEGPDPAFWVSNDYVVIVADQRGGFKSGGKPESPFKNADDIFYLIDWAAGQPWSSGNVGMIGVSALASNQYYTASHQPAPPHLKAIIPWESQTDRYRDSTFLGGIPETNFTRSVGPFKASLEKMPPAQAAKAWAAAMDPVANQNMLQGAPRLDLITIPTLLCASWSDKGLHTRGAFEAFRRIASRDKWLFTHGGKKWERFYSDEGRAYQKKFFDHYLKGIDNGWEATPRVRLEVRETRDEYVVRPEKEWPLARTAYKKLYLDGLTTP